MKKKIGLTILFLLFLVAVFFIFLFYSYNLVTKQHYEAEVIFLEDREDVEILEPASTITQLVGEGEIVYQYFYLFDGVTKEEILPIEDYLIGASLQQVEQIFPNWQVLLFSSDRIILRTGINAKSDEVYCVGAINGYLTIFQENDNMKMKVMEETKIPINVLPEYDQLMLRQGIDVIGKDNLIKLLADFTT